MNLRNENVSDVLADKLSTRQDYRVLRRIRPLHALVKENLAVTGRVAVAGVVATGSCSQVDELLELRVSILEISADHHIVRWADGTHAAFQPVHVQTSATVQRKAGVWPSAIGTDSLECLENTFSSARLIVMADSQALFPVLSAALPNLRDIPIACIRRDIPWASLGVSSIGLDSILHGLGLFCEQSHSARGQIESIQNILATAHSERSSLLGELLARSERATSRIELAIPSPHLTEILLARGYRMVADRGVMALDLEDCETDGEFLSLCEIAPLADRIWVSRLTALERFR